MLLHRFLHRMKRWSSILPTLLKLHGFSHSPRPKMPPGSPSVSMDQSPALPLSLHAAELPESQVFGQGSLSVMLGAGVLVDGRVLGATVEVTVTENGCRTR